MEKDLSVFQVDGGGGGAGYVIHLCRLSLDGYRLGSPIRGTYQTILELVCVTRA